MYQWIVIVGGIFAFFAAAGIGSNDAANAFATSVGSKALTIRQAVVLAALFETSGAILMGSHVTNTIRKGISDYRCFVDDADLLMYGNMWVIFAVGLWLFIASYFEMPVSTTHSCVGGMIGMTMILKGTDCVIWYKSVDTFPYIGGVGGIITSWFISPILSGLISCLIFFLTRKFVLRKEFNSNRINFVYPILIGATLTINSFFIIYKGAKGLGLHKIPFLQAFGMSFGIGIVSSLITIPLVKRLKEYVNNKYQQNDIELAPIEIKEGELYIKSNNELNRVTKLHNDAEKFSEKTEEVFKYLQIFTAVCDSFSHGANDVANAVGPFATIWVIYQSGGKIDNKSNMNDDAYWILGLGGIGIAAGLLIYGKKITYAIGEKLVKITPSRGVSIELSSALVIILGSRLKIPLSTTHCQVGATIGVGLLENKKSTFSGINCRVFLKTALGWVITCFIVGLTSAVLISQGIQSPSDNKYICNNNSLIEL